MNQLDQHQEPLAELSSAAAPLVAVVPRACPRSAVRQWMTSAAEQLSRRPGVWLAMAAVYGVLALFIAVIPFVQFSLTALWPVCLGGVMLGCAAVDNDEELEFTHLFAGFQSHFSQLILLGLGYFVTVVMVCALLAGIVGVGALLVWIVHYLLGQGAQVEMVLAAIAVVVGAVVLLLTGAVILLAAVIVWLATPLVVLNGYLPWDAVKLAFTAARLNRWPLGIFCVIVAVLSVFSVMSMLIGFLLWLPLWWITIYSAYKDIFVVAVPDENVSRTLNI